MAGALSMAVGEYVSVSTQRDTERALLAKERRELRETPEAELAELTQIYEDKGLSRSSPTRSPCSSPPTTPSARTRRSSSQIDPDELTSPWHAAFASLGSFTVGALLPLLAIALPPPGGRSWSPPWPSCWRSSSPAWSVRPARRHAPWRDRWPATSPAACWPWPITYGIGSLVGIAG